LLKDKFFIILKTRVSFQLPLSSDRIADVSLVKSEDAVTVINCRRSPSDGWQFVAVGKKDSGRFVLIAVLALALDVDRVARDELLKTLNIV
jgi:hypothetical protein